MTDHLDALRSHLALRTGKPPPGQPARHDVVAQLRDGCIEHPRRWAGDTHTDLGGTVDAEATDALMARAAGEIEYLRDTLDARRQQMIRVRRELATTRDLLDEAQRQLRRLRKPRWWRR